MVLYYLFWMFYMHYNVLYECQFLFFPCFWVSQKRNTKRSANGIKPSRWFFLGQKTTRRLGDEVGGATRRPQGQRARPHPCGPPMHLLSPDLIISPLYSQISPNHQRHPRKHFSTATTFYTREIPSRDLFRHPVGGGFDHGGFLHQLHCPSDEAWVVYHRPTGK